MICPLLTIATQDHVPGGAPLRPCLEGECALYDPNSRTCALCGPIIDISDHLENIDLRLGDIQRNVDRIGREAYITEKEDVL